MKFTTRLLLASALATLVGCSGGGKSPTTPNKPAGEPVDLLDNEVFNNVSEDIAAIGYSHLGGARLSFDLEAGTGEVLPYRSGSATDDT